MENRFKLSVRNLTKVFVTEKKEALVVDDVSIDVKENEFLVLLGPGQCGKSVLLSMIAGLMAPTMGTVFLDGEEKRGITTDIAMVFQRVNLLPWLTVTKNVEFGLKYAGVPKSRRAEIAKKYIDMVGLSGFETAYPHQLSGGMKQRVGIARAYANSPEVLLMDEPFGALDAQTRYAMEDEILKIWSKEKRTVIFVTNNIEEAVYLADRIILFSKKPATVKQVFDLSGMERPRNNMNEEFLRVRRQVADQMDLDLGEKQTVGGSHDGKEKE